MDRETVVSRLFESVSKGKRDRDQNVVQTVKDRQISKKSLNGKLNRPSEEEKFVQQSFYESEADVEVQQEKF